MKKLRLIITEKCNRKCSGCCNNDWNIDKLPVITDFSKYNEIIITGGEPMLYSHLIKHLCQIIRKQNKKVKIIL